MKIDSPKSPIFAGFDPLAPFESHLPESSPKVLQTPQLANVLLERNWSNFADTTRGIAGRTGLNYGVLPQAVDQFRDLFTELGKHPAVADLKTDALRGVTRAVNEAISGVLAAVPYVRIAVNLGIAIRKLMASAQAQAAATKLPEQAQLVYKRQDDTTGGQAVLAAYNSGDLTDIFLPPFSTLYAGPEWESEHITWTPGGTTAAGRSVKLKGINHDAVIGHGCLPGIAEQEGWSEYAFEYEIQTGIGTTGSPFTSEITTLGQTHPSVRQLAMEIWQAANVPGPVMFQLRPGAIVDAWDEYYRSLFGFYIVSDGRDQQQFSDQIVRMCSAASAFRARQGDKFEFRQVSRFSGIPAKVMREIRDPVSADVKMKSDIRPAPLYPMSRLIRYQVAKLKARMRPTLGTIVCAYVPFNAPAFEDDPALGSYHAKMRGLLLQHPARCDVELDLIPDQAYRTAMAEAQARINCGLAMVGTGTRPHRVRPPTIDPEGEPEPPPGPQGAPVEDAGDDAVATALAISLGLGLGALLLS